MWISKLSQKHQQHSINKNSIEKWKRRERNWGWTKGTGNWAVIPILCFSVSVSLSLRLSLTKLPSQCLSLLCNSEVCSCNPPASAFQKDVITGLHHHTQFPYSFSILVLTGVNWGWERPRHTVRLGLVFLLCICQSHVDKQMFKTMLQPTKYPHAEGNRVSHRPLFKVPSVHPCVILPLEWLHIDRAPTMSVSTKNLGISKSDGLIL